MTTVIKKPALLVLCEQLERSYNSPSSDTLLPVLQLLTSVLKGSCSAGGEWWPTNDTLTVAHSGVMV